MKKICILITLIVTILTAGCTNDSFPPQTSTQQSGNLDEKFFDNNKWNELSELREKELPLNKETITKSEYKKLIKKPISYVSLVLEGYEGALFCSTRNIVLSYPVIQTNNANVEEQIITYLKLPDVFSNNLIVDQSGDNIYVLD